jgi:predicted transcriptional regulator
VARYVAERLEINQDRGWEKLKDLKHRLEKLETIGSSESQEQNLFDDDLPFE